jgi:hypothetical protein
MEKGSERIIGILSKAESDLREVIVEAAQEGDYRSVDMARTAAVNVNNIKVRIKNPSSKGQAKGVSGVAHRKRKGLSRKGGKSGYPKFDVKNDTLIRMGWSRKERSKYTHKTPRVVFDRTVEAMAALARSEGGPFMAEQIIEQVNHMESETVPSYQVYVVIGLLRKRECIKQVGREGYDIPTDVAAKAEKEWQGLLGKNEVKNK